MKSLSNYLTESLLLEFKQDLMPQTILVIGGPGAGKTYWMEHDAPNFFKRYGDYKRLDSDHNLMVVQRENCKDMAYEILNDCRTDSISPYKNQQETFNELIKRKQAEYDENSKKNGSPLTDLSQIKLKWCKPWLERFTKATPDYKDKVYKEYEQAFFKEYFNKVFASDFSSRHLSQKQYYKDLENKLGGDSVTKMKNDVIVALTGDKISKFEDLIKLSEGRSVVVVYLNIPEEISVAQDAKRNRSVGREMIHNKLENIHKTWDYLTKNFEDMGIFRMYELLPTEESVANKAIKGWRLERSYLNKRMIG